MPKNVQDLTILLVDDNPNARKLMTRVLSEMGVHVIVQAENAIQGFKAFQTSAGTIDLIICDWQMPVVSGLDFLKRMKALHPEVPFIMVTGKGDIDSVKDAGAHGVTGYIVKPYSPMQVQEKLFDALKVLPA